jgi:hypothetical protein
MLAAVDIWGFLVFAGIIVLAFIIQISNAKDGWVMGFMQMSRMRCPSCYSPIPRTLGKGVACRPHVDAAGQEVKGVYDCP